MRMANVHPTTGTEPAYPFAVHATRTGLSASALQFPAMATADDRPELFRLLAEQVALYLLDARLEGRTPEPPLPAERLDRTVFGADAEIVHVRPATVSVASEAIERALREEGLAYVELARRMNVPRSVESRITNPFYFGHTSRTLRQVAAALGRELRVGFVSPANAHGTARSAP